MVYGDFYGIVFFVGIVFLGIIDIMFYWWFVFWVVGVVVVDVLFWGVVDDGFIEWWNVLLEWF